MPLGLIFFLAVVLPLAGAGIFLALWVLVFIVLPVTAVGALVYFQIIKPYQEAKEAERLKPPDLGPQRGNFPNEAEYVEARMRWLDGQLRPQR